jgi:hypothetical protein
MLLNNRKWVTRPERSLGHDMKDHQIEIQFLKQQEICLFSVASRRFLGSLQPPIQVSSLEKGARDIKLTIHLCLVPRLRMDGAKPPLWDFMAYTGTASL